MHLAGGGSLETDDPQRLALTLLTQMRFRKIYEFLVDEPGLIQSFKELMIEPGETRDKGLEASAALKAIHEDRNVRKFFDIARDLDCSEATMRKCVLFTQGENQ